MPHQLLFALLVVAFVLTLLAAIDKVKAWVPLLFVSLVLIVEHWPWGK